MSDIRSLPLEAKENLYLSLGRMIARERQRTWKEDMKRIVGVVELVSGVRIGNKRRSRAIFTARVIAVNLLLEQGYDELKVAYIIDRDRTTIYFYRKVLESWKENPAMYDSELELMNKIREDI